MGATRLPMQTVQTADCAKFILMVSVSFLSCHKKGDIFRPRNYRRQKAIAFDIALEEKIIDSKFLPSITYLQFAVNLSLFC